MSEATWCVTLKRVALGRDAVEYLDFRRAERRLRKSKTDEAESRWVVSEADWPGRHADDVTDQRAAELIWSTSFATAATGLGASFMNQPVADDLTT
jgi:hypothetical protein